MASAPLRVATNNGEVEGFVRRGMRRFRGIPYAEPPVGPLRLRAPRPAQPWDGVRRCKRFGAAPYQPKIFTPQKQRSEDCLTLNVVAPEQLPDGPLPVMFYIYGGGYFLGSSSSPPYEGSILARRGCVYVSANYRVGAFGAFDLSSLSDDKHVIESNLYLRDLVLALQWVRDNIAAFGGDPENVTIFGESAGGSGVETLMATPAAAGLFHKAIIQSTASGLAADADSVAHDARRFAEILGATSDNAAATVLNASPRRLLRAQRKLIAEGGFPFGPSVDGNYLPKKPVESIEGGEAHRVPLIIGSNADEAKLFTKAIKVMPLWRPNSWRYSAAGARLPGTDYRRLCGIPVDAGSAATGRGYVLHLLGLADCSGPPTFRTRVRLPVRLRTLAGAGRRSGGIARYRAACGFRQLSGPRRPDPGRQLHPPRRVAGCR